MKNSNTIAAVLFFIAAILSFITAAIGRNIVFVPIGCCDICVGCLMAVQAKAKAKAKPPEEKNSVEKTDDILQP